MKVFLYSYPRSPFFKFFQGTFDLFTYRFWRRFGSVVSLLKLFREGVCVFGICHEVPSDNDSDCALKSDQESVCVNNQMLFCYYQNERRV